MTGIAERALTSLQRFGSATVRQLAGRLGESIGAVQNAVYRLYVRGDLDHDYGHPRTYHLAKREVKA